MEVASCDFLEECRNIVIVKRKPAHQQHVENHTATPHIDLGSGVQLARDHLGRCIVGATAAGFQEIAIRHDIAETKVGNLDILIGIDEQVFWLQITVDDLVPVTIFHGADDLLKELTRLVIITPSLSHEVVEKFSLRMFQDHDDIGFGGNHRISGELLC